MKITKIIHLLNREVLMIKASCKLIAREHLGQNSRKRHGICTTPENISFKIIQVNTNYKNFRKSNENLNWGAF